MKKVKYRECPTLEVLDPVCQRSVYPPIDDYVREATEIALCGVKPSKTRERSHEWLEVTRGQTYRLPGVRINNWFEEGQDIAHLRREHSILSDVRCYKYYGQSSSWGLSAVGAFLQATSRVPRWWIGERPPDMAASCDIYK